MVTYLQLENHKMNEESIMRSLRTLKKGKRRERLSLARETHSSDFFKK